MEVALALLEQQKDQHRQWLEETRRKIQIGIDELDRREGIEGKVVMERLQAKLRQARDRG
ncbi:MAG: hypothetical protein HC921_06195 [Synechococcaceae cyanobacterium SM2_3_1]|nr:hypothetical protein [Synechococcaceae cyanobacterium SM2_3_1]